MHSGESRSHASCHGQSTGSRRLILHVAACDARSNVDELAAKFMESRCARVLSLGSALI